MAHEEWHKAWMEDEDFVAWLMQKSNDTREMVLRFRCGMLDSYDAWLGGRASLLPQKKKIFQDWCWLLECEMATLGYIRDITRTAKHEISRHEKIIQEGLFQVRICLADNDGLEVPRDCPRVYESIHPEETS